MASYYFVYYSFFNCGWESKSVLRWKRKSLKEQISDCKLSGTVGVYDVQACGQVRAHLFFDYLSWNLCRLDC